MFYHSVRIAGFAAIGILSWTLNVAQAETVALTVTVNSGSETIQTTNSVTFDTKLIPAGNKNGSKQSAMQGGIIYAARSSSAADDSAGINIGPKRAGQGLNFSGIASITKKIPAPSEPPVSPITIGAPGATSPFGNTTTGGPTSPSKKWDTSAGSASGGTTQAPSGGGTLTANFSPAISVITPLPSSSWAAVGLLAFIAIVVRYGRLTRKLTA